VATTSCSCVISERLTSAGLGGRSSRARGEEEAGAGQQQPRGSGTAGRLSTTCAAKAPTAAIMKMFTAAPPPTRKPFHITVSTNTQTVR